VIISKN